MNPLNVSTPSHDHSPAAKRSPLFRLVRSAKSPSLGTFLAFGLHVMLPVSGETLGQLGAANPLPATVAEASPGDVIWSIGEKDGTGNEFALAPDGFESFKHHDFGYEDKFFAIGFHNDNKDIPYVLPGPVDTWGGTWGTSGWRSNQINILFSLEEEPADTDYILHIELADFAKEFLPVVKVHINDQEQRFELVSMGYDRNLQRSPSRRESVINENALKGDRSFATPETLSIPIDINVIRKGGNQITITVVEGSWILFDQIRLEGPESVLHEPESLFLKDVAPANYHLGREQGIFQPLLINVEHLQGTPVLRVALDGETILEEIVEMGQYVYEALMPAVQESVTSNYTILVDDQEIESGLVTRSPQTSQTIPGYVDTRIGSAHARWMYAPGPWMPFSMVKLSPINQNAGWMAVHPTGSALTVCC